MTDGVTRAKLGPEPGDRFLSLRRALGITSFGMNQILLAPGQRGRIHRHKGQEEVYLVLAGTLTLIVEDEPHEYAIGEVVRVPPSVRRQLINRHRAELSLIALGGFVAHEHEGRDAEAFTDWADTEPGTPQTTPGPEDLPDSELIG